MIRSHGPGAHGLHLVGNFYPLQAGQKASEVPQPRTSDDMGRLPRHITSQPTLYVIGEQTGPSATLRIETKNSYLDFSAPTFAKRTIAFSTLKTALADAEAALSVAKTPGHRNRVRARIDVLQAASEYEQLPNAIWYVGADGHLYTSITTLAPGSKLLPKDEIESLRDTLLPYLAPIVVKNKDVTQELLDGFLARGMVDIDAFVTELYPAVSMTNVLAAVDSILDCAALTQYIRGASESSVTVGEYLDGFLLDAALVRERAKAFKADDVIVSNYDRSLNMGEACSRLSGVPLTRIECLQLHMLIEDSLTGKYTESQRVGSSFFDVGDYLLLLAGYSVTAAGSRVTLTYRDYISIANFDISFDGVDFGKLRDAFRKAVIGGYQFMFDSNNPLLFTWAELGSLYFKPAIKG